jgi:hypothetical protein
MNHCISFIWSSFDSVEGWNSASIHFFAAASSAKAGALTAADAAINATALAIVKKRVLFVAGRMISSVELQVRVDPGSASFFTCVPKPAFASFCSAFCANAGFERTPANYDSSDPSGF